MNYAYWFANIPGLSNCAKISIHEKVGNAQDIYFLSEKQMENLQLLAKEIQAVRAAQKTDMEEAYAKMCESGISFVSLEDASYPKRLRHIANPPYGLYVKGCLPQGETVAIVGARMCSEYGRTVARELGRMLAARGVGVVSGMARGIDAAGHQGALDVGGISCAVLGCGVDVCYPKSSRALYEEILERGSVVSEYPPGTQPIPGYFPLVSLCHACCILDHAHFHDISIRYRQFFYIVQCLPTILLIVCTHDKCKFFFVHLHLHPVTYAFSPSIICLILSSPGASLCIFKSSQ